MRLLQYAALACVFGSFGAVLKAAPRFEARISAAMQPLIKM
jgi:hypothetical protein